MKMQAAPLFGLLATLYLAQGLPAGLTAHALPTLLREQDVALSLVTLSNLLALPWLFKFLWAPFLDQRRYRLAWLLGIQALAFAVFLLLALFSLPEWLSQQAQGFIILLISVNFLMSCHDVLTDGSAVRLLSDRQKGVGNTFQVAGYKVGMIIGGSGLLYGVGALGWSSAVIWISALGLMLWLVTVLLSRPFYIAMNAASPAQTPAKGSNSGMWQSWRGFFAQPNMLWWVAIVLTFKLGDSLVSGLVRPYWVDQGLTLAWIGQVGAIGVLASLLGALLGGLLYRAWGNYRSLVLAGSAQALCLLGYGFGAVGLNAEEHETLLALVFLLEQVADGASTVVLFAAMMKACRIEYAGVDYTLQACLFLWLTGVLKVISGKLAQTLGYPMIFVISASLFLLTLWLLVKWKQRGEFLPPTTQEHSS
ncbi:MAG: MFS transporter [Pseudomonadota bacterium]|nr:MFS transporter [Pseudomonadota bacterium]